MAFIERMTGQDYIDKSRKYLDYLEEHLNNVKRAFNELSKACDSMWWVGDDMTWHTLRTHVIHHDLSKFTKEEFTQYRDSFFPVNDCDKKCSGFDGAWENHKKENDHHHESATDLIHIVHMVIDWTAMGYKFGDTAQQYYEANQEKIALSDDHKEFMYTIFNKIKS